MRVHFGAMSNRFKASKLSANYFTSENRKFTKFYKISTQSQRSLRQDGALRNCKAVTTLTIQVASIIIIAISSNKSHGTIITISRKTKCEKHEPQKKPTRVALLNIRSQTTYQCTKQVYKRATKL